MSRCLASGPGATGAPGDLPLPTRSFLTNIIDEDMAKNTYNGRVLTRFPPEPNGYLHLGHAKSIYLNFGLARAYGGKTNMRFDDTNPAKEDLEYVRSILEDVRWLLTGDTQGPAPWAEPVRHASDYFPLIEQAGEYLIRQGMAYVDHLTAEQLRDYRGTLTVPGRESPFRDRSVEENLHHFANMRNGSYADGECVLRAKIDMRSPNVNMRDPSLFRVRHMVHPVTGTMAYAYPLYDFAHAISDALEGITHSLCSLEFEDHRPLYDWTIDSLLPSGILPTDSRPRQHEFSRLNMQGTVLSKRHLIALVEGAQVSGWDDPRMPTIAGLRRRGVPHRALALFCCRLGASKADSSISPAMLDEAIRDVLEGNTPEGAQAEAEAEAAGRLFALQDPLMVTLTNLPAPLTCKLDNHPTLPMGQRQLQFTSSLFIDRADFHDTSLLPAPKGWKRLVPQGSVRLKNAFVIHCHEVLRDAQGKAIELLCSYDPASGHGAPTQTLPKAKGIVQWLPAVQALAVSLRMLGPLLAPRGEGDEHIPVVDPSSMTVLHGMVENNVLQALSSGQRTFQFERLGYFALDQQQGKDKEGKEDEGMVIDLVFNRVVTLKDTWAAKQQH